MKKDIIHILLITMGIVVGLSFCWIDFYLLKKYFPQDDNQEKIEVLEKENISLKDKLFDCQMREKVHL